ncbi:hypothetical protein BD410DRAFT_515321 [Rickenella mellea]|uniref:Uncharacterized protein n=1 Tax=Rickenella mellea TaxID=50990 RepID=A0A4Y7PSA3_9AGAM|nr:hypothetical protein BD410DRAFT_515321 [Rickenella mellea]
MGNNKIEKYAIKWDGQPGCGGGMGHAFWWGLVPFVGEVVKFYTSCKMIHYASKNIKNGKERWWKGTKMGLLHFLPIFLCPHLLGVAVYLLVKPYRSSAMMVGQWHPRKY